MLLASGTSFSPNSGINLVENAEMGGGGETAQRDRTQREQRFSAPLVGC